MGETAKKLLDRLKKGRSLTLPTGINIPVPDLELMYKRGMNELHACYVITQQITAAVSDFVSKLPQMKAYAKIVKDAEEAYLPSGPPLSPLTKSFFTTWAFYDLAFDGTDTLTTCMLEAQDVLGFNRDNMDALNRLSASYMGLYEHIGMDGSHVRLRELETNEEFTCLITSGYRGETGELWYVRLLPPLVSMPAPYHIAFTTPYILLSGKSEWMEFLERNLIPEKSEERKQTMRRFLKNGSNPNYWNEYVFLAYVNHQHDAVFLTGIPDRRETLPHA